MEYIEYDLPTAPPTQTIILTPEERTVADRLGKAKNDKSENEGREADWYDTDGGSTVENHQDGVACEMAHLKYLGFDLKNFETEYYRVDTFKMADIGRNTEVRSTKMTGFAGKVKDCDIDTRNVVFYRKISQLEFRALGWLRVGEAKKVGLYLDPKQRNKWAYFVTDKQLHPLETLPAENW